MRHRVASASTWRATPPDTRGRHDPEQQQCHRTSTAEEVHLEWLGCRASRQDRRRLMRARASAQHHDAGMRVQELQRGEEGTGCVSSAGAGETRGRASPHAIRSTRGGTGGGRGVGPESLARPRSAAATRYTPLSSSGRGTDSGVGYCWRKASIPWRNMSRDVYRGRLGAVGRVVDVEQARRVDLLTPVGLDRLVGHGPDGPADPVLPADRQPQEQELVAPGCQRLPLRAGLADQEADPLGPDVTQDDRAHAGRVDSAGMPGGREDAEVHDRVTRRSGPLPVVHDERDGIDDLGGHRSAL